MPRTPKGRTPAKSAPAQLPDRRRGHLRIRPEAATRVRAGHPWVFRDALRQRGALPDTPGQIVSLQDPDGQFVATGYWETEGAVAIRILSWDPRTRPGSALYRRRAQQALAQRLRLLPPETTAYRVINGEGDGLPGLTVDRFGDYLVAHLYTLAAEPMAEAIYPLLLEETGTRGLYEQRRLRPVAGEKRPGAELKLGKSAPAETEASEHGLNFLVTVNAPLGVGLFPDLREVRHYLGSHAKGLRVLNAFSYTGAITVHLAHGGAEVLAVDRASRVHSWARKDLKLNGLDDPALTEHRTAEVSTALHRLSERGDQFDLVVLDPPSFARGRKGSFSTTRDYAELMRMSLGVLAPGGWVLAVCNTAKLDDGEFARALGRGALRAGRPLQVIRRFGLPHDFPVPPAFAEGYYLKPYLCRVMD